MRLMQRLIMGLSAAALVACGGGESGPGTSGDSTDTVVRLSGLVQKGPFTQLQVRARHLDPDTGKLGDPIEADVQGTSYQVDVPDGPLYVIEARGRFRNETTGKTVRVDQPLKALAPLNGQDRSAHVNLATHLSSERFLNGSSDSGTPWKDRLNRTNDFVSQTLGLGEGTDPTQLDLSAIKGEAGLEETNLSLLLFSGALSNTLSSENLFGPEVADLVARVRSGSDPLSLKQEFDFFAGLDASQLYELIRQHIPEWSLPEVTLPDTPIWQCPVGQSCGWISQPEPLLSIASVAVYEGQGAAKVTLRLSQALSQDVAVKLTTAAGTALKNQDFRPLEQNVVIAAGEMTHSITVPLVVDNRDEETESFRLTAELLTQNVTLAQPGTQISVLNGVPDSLAGQTPTQVTVASTCIHQIGVPDQLSGTACMTPDATSISGADNDAASVEIDLALNCAALDSCADDGSNWLVEFMLLAQAGDGATEAEVSLGRYVYRAETLQLTGATDRSQALLLSLSTAATRRFLSESLDAGRALVFEARLVGAAQQFSQLDLQSLVPVPDQLVAGDQTLALAEGVVLSGGGAQNCAEHEYGLSGDYSLNPSSTLTGDVCIELATAADGSIDGVMTAGALDLYGATLPLPTGVVALYSPGGDRPVPSGDAELAIINSELWRDSSRERKWLHQQGMPVMFRVSGGQLTPAGLVVAYDRVQYLMDPGYSSQDPRAGGKVVSNDVLYKSPGPDTGVLGWGANGLTVDLTLAAHAGHTAFPKGEMLWDAVTLNYLNGELAVPSPVSLDYYLVQSSSCRSADCQTVRDRPYHIAGSVDLDDRGFMQGTAGYQPFDIGDTLYTVVPAWGPREKADYADNNDPNTFTRPDDLAAGSPVTLTQAGYRFPADRDRASDFLVAHIEPAAGQARHGVHALGSAAERDGNHFPTGLSLGPQTYRDANGQPDLGLGQWLTTKPLVFDNGDGGQPMSLPASAGAKYTIRNGGITGVFNIDSAALTDPLAFYGYDLALDRFAIRVIDNALDDENWLDGATEINGDAGLAIHFENLTLDCAGRFGQAEVVYESCDGLDDNGNGYVDENCGQQLASWRADTEVFGMNFTAADGANACAIGSQQLRLQQQVDFLALNKPIGLDSTWTPEGAIGDQLLTLLDDYRLDAVTDKSEGFALVPSAGAFSVVDLASEPEPDPDPETTTRYGAFDIASGLIAVPFWESISADVRLANWLSGTTPVAEPSVVLPDSTLTEAMTTKRTGLVYRDDVRNGENENLHLQARYPWGNTGFEFQLPVYFSPHQDRFDGQSKFLGRRVGADLFVMEAGAGINYIEPDRTKLSFGASADFERLQELNIQVDLNNPDSLGQVDQWLVSLGVIGQPVLKPALDKVMSPVSVINRYADKGLDTAMREGLVLAVEQLGAQAPQDPFVVASQGMAQVKNFPQQLVLLLDEEVKAPIDGSLNELEQTLRDHWADLESSIYSVQNDGGLDFTALKNVQDTLDELHAGVEQVNNQVAQPVRMARNLIDELSGIVTDVETAVTDIDQLLVDATAITATQCNAPNYDLDTLKYGYLQEMVVNLDQVQTVLGIVENDALLDPLTTLVVNDPAVKQRLNDAQQALRRQAEVLAGYLDDAQTAIKNQVCGATTDSLLIKARALLSPIGTAAQDLGANLDTVKGHLNTVTNLQTELATKVLTPISQVSEALDKLKADWDRGDYTGTLGSDIMTALNDDLADLTGGQVTAFVAIGGTETDLLGLMFDTARNELNTQYQTMRDALLATMDTHIPGAYYSPGQLRLMLVNQLMDTAPVAQLRLAMNQHFDEITRQVNDVALQLTDQVNQAVQEAIKAVTSQANEALASAQSVVRDLPLKGGRLDGYGVIAGDELERAHVGAEWAMAAAEEGEDPNTFKAALDAVSWDANNKTAGCSIPSGQSRLDVTISGYNIPATIASSELTVEKVYLGFTLASGTTYALAPKGVFGGIDTLGDIGFTEFVIYDPALAAGIGDKEAYLGARAGALFSDVQAEVAFLAGRTCNQDILLELDPEVAKFIELPGSGFTGAYARGSASFPVITTGCPLTVGVGADFGAWVLVGEPTSVGGLVGGGAYGRVACVGALRGQVRALGEVNTDGDMTFIGEGFGVAGVGSCEPAGWTSVSRSRNDSWCATGDARFQAGYQNGWSVLDLTVSAVH